MVTLANSDICEGKKEGEKNNTDTVVTRGNITSIMAKHKV